MKQPAIRIAVIQFPGSNCEMETARAVEFAGMRAEVFRWNRNPKELEKFHGFVLGGGFSYQDRVRAGAVAAKEPVMQKISEENRRGKPVLGICNGCQVLVESGLVPGIRRGRVEMAMAPNRMERDGRVVRRGYFCTWVYVKHAAQQKRSFLTTFLSDGEVFPIPMAHGEGRFITRDKALQRKLQKNRQILLQYCTKDGEVMDGFPVNPNGSLWNAAAVCNEDGNVVAIMPHPERAAFLRQIPASLAGGWGQQRKENTGNSPAMEEEGPGRKLFLSMKTFIEDNVEC